MFVEDEKMNLDSFITLFQTIINDFISINESYDNINKLTINEYDEYYKNWIKNYAEKYPLVKFDMHWTKNSKYLDDNEILFDIIYREYYFFEVKYKFGDKFLAFDVKQSKLMKTFELNLSKFMDNIKSIIGKFIIYNVRINIPPTANIKEYEKFFLEWKKEIYAMYPNFTVDIYWINQSTIIRENAIKFIIMYKDDFLAQIMYYFNFERPTLDLNT